MGSNVLESYSFLLEFCHIRCWTKGPSFHWQKDFLCRCYPGGYNLLHYYTPCSWGGWLALTEGNNGWMFLHFNWILPTVNWRTQHSLQTTTLLLNFPEISFAWAIGHFNNSMLSRSDFDSETLSSLINPGPLRLTPGCHFIDWNMCP